MNAMPAISGSVSCYCGNFQTCNCSSMGKLELKMKLPNDDTAAASVVNTLSEFSFDEELVVVHPLSVWSITTAPPVNTEIGSITYARWNCSY